MHYFMTQIRSSVSESNENSSFLTWEISIDAHVDTCSSRLGNNSQFGESNKGREGRKEEKTVYLNTRKQSWPGEVSAK